MEEAYLELDCRVIFGRRTEILDELVVLSIEEAELVLHSPEHDLAFEIMNYEWAQVFDGENRLQRYFIRQNGKFLRSRGLELALNPKPSKKKFKEFEIRAVGDGDSNILKMKVTGEKLADALQQARSISKAFLEFREGGKIKDFEYEGLHEEDASPNELPEIKTSDRAKQKDHPEELLRRARNHFKKGKWTEALELFGDALPKTEEPLDDLIAAAKAGIEAHRFPIAEKFARRILARQPKNPDALMVMGQIYSAWQNFDESVHFWKKAFDERPEDSFVKKCYQQAVARNSKRPQKTISEDEVFKQMDAEMNPQEKRTWERRSCEYPIFIKGENFQEVRRYNLVSLSAGGALIKIGSEDLGLPQQFQFFINLPDFRTVIGIGEKVYQTNSGQVGIQFEVMAPSDRALLNEEVLRLPK